MSTLVSRMDEAAVNSQARPWKISLRLLLAVYSFIPIVWLVVILDHFYFQGNLRGALPKSPEKIFWFTAIFVLPHILASQFSFYDGAYLKAYGKRLIYGLPVVIVAALALYRFNAGSSGLIFNAVTMWHVIAQQVGIAGVLSGSTSRAFLVWKWLSIGLFTMGVTGILDAWLNWVGGIILLVTTLLTTDAARRAERSIGRHYLWATQGMLLSTALFAAGGYFFFAVLVPRVVHDLTAWVFYLTHDHNRNLGTVCNGLYRVFVFTHLPVVVIVLALSVGVNVVLELNLGRVYSPVILVVSLFHYYSESFMWKRHSIHRGHVAFSS